MPDSDADSARNRKIWRGKVTSGVIYIIAHSDFGMSALGHTWTNLRRPKSTFVRYCPKADNMLRCVRLLKGETLLPSQWFGAWQSRRVPNLYGSRLQGTGQRCVRAFYFSVLLLLNARFFSGTRRPSRCRCPNLDITANFPAYPSKADIPRGGQNVRFVDQRLRKPPTMSARTRLLLLRRPGPCWLEGRAIRKSERHERSLPGQTKSGAAPRR